MEIMQKTIPYLSLCEKETFGSEKIIKTKPVNTKVIPMYLWTQEKAAMMESKNRIDHRFSFKNFCKQMINKTTSKINSGSVHAMTETPKSGMDNKIETTPKITSIFDRIHVRNNCPEVKIISPKTIALKNLAPFKGSMPVNPRIANIVENNGGYDIKDLPLQVR